MPFEFNWTYGPENDLKCKQQYLHKFKNLMYILFQWIIFHHFFFYLLCFWRYLSFLSSLSPYMEINRKMVTWYSFHYLSFASYSVEKANSGKHKCSEYTVESTVKGRKLFLASHEIFVISMVRTFIGHFSLKIAYYDNDHDLR